MALRLPWRPVSCWMIAGDHITSSTTATQPATFRQGGPVVVPRRVSITASVNPQRAAVATSGAYPTWSCTRKLPVSTTPTACQRDPVASSHTCTRNSTKNGSATCGFHGSTKMLSGGRVA